MRTSSTQAPDPSGYGLGVTDGDHDDLMNMPRGASPQAEIVSSEAPKLSAPSVAAYGGAYADAARALARLNATTVKEDEESALHIERAALLDKKFAKTITHQEENRLEYVRWCLGRIEDAKNGPSLDALERMVGAYEGFLGGMQKFGQELNDAVAGQRESSRSRSKAAIRRGHK